MPIKIKAGDGKAFHPNMESVPIEITDIKTGADLTKSIRAIDIRMAVGEITTAKIEIEVGEIDIDGVVVVPVKKKTVSPLDIVINVDTGKLRGQLFMLKKDIKELKDAMNYEIDQLVSEIKKKRKELTELGEITVYGVLALLIIGIAISFGVGFNPFKALIDIIVRAI